MRVHSWFTGSLLTVSACGLTMGLAGAAMAQDTGIGTAGANEYHMSCAVCHGADGKGNGPMVKALTVKPSDLTQLSKNNHGAFPFLKVFQTIDGRTQVDGHGTREMPIWGARYEAQAGDKYGPYGGEVIVRGRVLALVYYLETIQQK